MSALPSLFRPRLFDPESASPEPAGGTVSHLWQTVHLDLLTDESDPRAPATIREYATYLRRWQQFWAEGGSPKWTKPQRAMDHMSIAPAAAEPPANTICTVDLRAWREWLKERVVCGDRSRNKHIGLIVSILRSACDAGHLTHAPRCRSVPVQAVARKLYLALEEVGGLYEACRVATWPTRDRRKRPLTRGPVVQWRALLAEFVNYGFRTQELVAFQPRRSPLLWKNISQLPDTPNPDGKMTSPHGWLWYLPQKQARHKSTPLFLPLNATTAAHFESVRPDDAQPDDPIFPWPHSGKRFYAQWERILAAAGIKPKSVVEDPDSAYLVKHLRKTCATHLDRHWPGLAELVLGHAERGAGITSKHYVNAEMTVRDGLLSLPQPPQFERVFETFRSPADPQRRLF